MEVWYYWVGVYTALCFLGGGWGLIRFQTDCVRPRGVGPLQTLPMHAGGCKIKGARRTTTCRQCSAAVQCKHEGTQWRNAGRWGSSVAERNPGPRKKNTPAKTRGKHIKSETPLSRPTQGQASGRPLPPIPPQPPSGKRKGG